MIKEAAIKRLSDGKVWTGRRHGDVIRKIIKETGIVTVKHSEYMQGFVTDYGEFVDRYEAFRIAVECDQLINNEDCRETSTLMSEDLY